MKKLIIIIVVICSFQLVCAQPETIYNQHSIQGHATAMFYLFTGVNYEIFLWEKPKTISGISFGIGYWDNGVEIPVHIYNLWNKESVHHLEVDYGINLLIIPADRVIPLPTLSLGYRYQDLSMKGFMFRGGLNLGIMPYLGVGYAF